MVFCQTNLKVLLTGLIVWSASWQATAQAEDWAFRRSYYTHDLNDPALAQAPMPVNRSAYRVPYMPQNPGGSVYSTWRLNRVQLRSGSSTDTQYFWQGSVEFRP